ncbi:MAG: hypothetical protein ACI9HA_003811, partial [Dinoroseobacter sp.]
AKAAMNIVPFRSNCAPSVPEDTQFEYCRKSGESTWLKKTNAHSP